MTQIGVIALGRPTFDVEFAQAKARDAFDLLSKQDITLLGSSEICLDEESAIAALNALKSEPIDALVVLQATFTDAAMIVQIANTFEARLKIWSFREPRTGGRLRLNSFCGLNLASHALGLNDIEFDYLYDDAIDVSSSQLSDWLSTNTPSTPMKTALQDVGEISPQAKDIIDQLQHSRIGRIGAHPVGFDTCAYDAEALKSQTGVAVDALELDELFEKASNVSDASIAEKQDALVASVKGIDDVDQAELSKSIKLHSALEEIKASGSYDAFAIRCWPETFTEYGGAVCGPVAMMGEAKTPCACEADVYGALTSLILQKASDQSPFLADIVDISTKDDTAVVWHCGQAPRDMVADGQSAAATIHSNRKMPLLFEFPLKAGRVTLMRISQSAGALKMVIASGEMIDQPLAFSGTAGVVKFDVGSRSAIHGLIDGRLEHHMALVYGDYKGVLLEIASGLNMPVQIWH